MRLALATCAAFPRLGPFDSHILTLLKRRGVDAMPAIWSDASIDWSVYDLTIVHSTWDAHQMPDTFLAWVDQFGPDLHNRPSTIKWNIHKGYLQDLAKQGIRIAETMWIGAGQDLNLERLLDDTGWEKAVVKPVISASANDTFLVTRANIHQIEELYNSLKPRDLLLQPFFRSFETHGETSLLYFNGQFSHAVRRPPTLSTDRTSSAIPTAWHASEAERAFAEQVMDFLPETPLHARVDLARDNHGELCLHELELIEPCLFTSLCPGSAERFVDAILVRC